MIIASNINFDVYCLFCFTGHCSYVYQCNICRRGLHTQLLYILNKLPLFHPVRRCSTVRCYWTTCRRRVRYCRRRRWGRCRSYGYRYTNYRCRKCRRGWGMGKRQCNSVIFICILPILLQIPAYTTYWSWNLWPAISFSPCKSLL